MRTTRRVRYFLLSLILLTNLVSLRPGSLYAQPAPATPGARPALPTQGPPRPHIKSSGAQGKPGNVQRKSAQQMVQAAAPQSMHDWQPDLTDDFEAGLGQTWAVSDESDDGANIQWGINALYAASGQQALWVAAGGTDGLDPQQFFYPANLDTWLTSQSPFDLSQAQMADVQFSLRYDTEPEADYLFVGASVDGQNFYGEYYSGDSGGWDTFDLDLSEYIGYSQVYVGWYFHSDANSQEKEGVWLDDVTVWTYTDTGPAQGQESIQNGDFETGDLSSWTVPSGSTVEATKAQNPVSGNYVAYFGGIPNASESFYQTLQLADSEVSKATLGFWVNQFGEETKPNADYFCAGIYNADNSALLLDLGCLNGLEATSATFNANNWRQVNIDLDAAAWQTVRGQTINLVFQMYTDEAQNTSVLIDDVTFDTVTGGATGDSHEPNNTRAQATLLTPGSPITDLTIDGDQDADLFKVNANAGDTLVADVDAASNGSPLDAVAVVVNEAGEQLCQNDDDGQTPDHHNRRLLRGGDLL